jgi:FAD-dependent fumarate reductase
MRWVEMSRKRILFGLSISTFVLITALLWNRLMNGTPKLTASPPSGQGAIVVGSGLAGLAGASQLIARNVPVTLLERAAKPGGNSIKASSGINGAPTKFQTVSDDLFFTDTVRSAGKAYSTHRDYRQRLITSLTNSSANAIDWLTEEKGIDLSKVTQLGGHSYARTHRGSGKTPPGAAIVTSLLKQLKESPLFKLQTSSHVTRILKEGPKVAGVEYSHNGKTEELHGPVIFATGGFAGDAKGLLSHYRQDLAGMPSTNDPKPGSHPILTEVGAQLLDMELVQVHPTGFIDPYDAESPLKFLAAEILRGEGGLLLLDGRRFVNEMRTRQHITDTIMAADPSELHPKQWNVQIVLDEGAYQAAKSHVDFYMWKGLMHKSTAGDIGPWATMVLQEYADAAAGKYEDELGRTSFGKWSLKEVMPDSVVYVGRVTPVVHFTMGGVVIGNNAEVLDSSGKAIPGLWAAGEIAGGVHGNNRLGGSSLLECVVFGRIAGDHAADFFSEGTSVNGT